MKIRNPQDLAAGCVFILVGAGAALIGYTQYRMGTLSNMGPGYFPTALGILLTLLGFAQIYRALRTEGEALEIGRLGPIAIVIGSIALFGVAIPVLGIVVTAVALVVVTSFASSEFKLKTAVISGLCLAATCYVVFIYGLGLIIPVWPVFLGVA